MSEVYADIIKDKLINGLKASHVEVKDTSGGCGQSFEVLVVSSEFEGKPLLQRHRLVNGCLAEELKIIHALSQKTYTPEQWTKMNT